MTGNWKKERGTVTQIMKDLEWVSLSERRRVQRLVILYKSIKGELHLHIPDYIQRKQRYTRSYNEDRFVEILVGNDGYKNSFFPRTIRDWNKLEGCLTMDSKNTESFRKELLKTIIP